MGYLMNVNRDHYHRRAEMDDYEVWKQEQLATVAKVACPRCKVAAGTPCDWGTTSNAWSVHKPRAKAAAK